MTTVNVDNFVRAETDLAFARLVGDQVDGISTWVHHRQPAPLDHQLIIRLNRDTLYSAAIADISQGGTIELPDPGDRYLSVMVVNQDHHIPRIFHQPGRHILDRDELGSDYVLLACRILVDPSDGDDVAAVNALQSQLGLETVSRRPFPMSDIDEESLGRTRQSLIALAADLPDFRRAFGRADEVDPVRHLLGTAAGWGGLPDYEAVYLNVNPELPVGEYTLRMVDVPVDAFWSVSLYNADGYFEVNDLGVNNVNSVTAVQDADGGVTIRFGSGGAGQANYLPIMPGWNFLIRLYLPRDVVRDGTWTPPAVEPLREGTS